MALSSEFILSNLTLLEILLKQGGSLKKTVSIVQNGQKNREIELRKLRMFHATQDTETIRIKIDPKVDCLRLYCCWAGKINWCQYNIYDQVIRNALIFRQSMRRFWIFENFLYGLKSVHQKNRSTTHGNCQTHKYLKLKLGSYAVKKLIQKLLFIPWANRYKTYHFSTLKARAYGFFQ